MYDHDYDEGLTGLAEVVYFSSPSTSNQVIHDSSPATQVIWTINQTKILLDLYKTYRPKVGTYEVKNLKKLWEILAREINKQLNMQFTANHIENRWRVLERAYKKFIDSQSKTGQGRRFFEYADQMDEIFKGKKNVKPVILLSNTSIEKMAEDEQNEDENQETPAMMSKPQISKRKDVMEDRVKTKRNPIANRNLTLAGMKKDRREYQEKRLRIEEEKLKVLKEKLKEMTERNLLLKERNEISKSRNCQCIS